MESKEKLNDIRDHLFAEISRRYDRDESFRIWFDGIMRTNEDFLKYIDGAYGIDVIAKDLDRLEKYDKAKELIKKKRVDVIDILNISKGYVKELWLLVYNKNHINKNKLTQEEFDFILEMFG